LHEVFSFYSSQHLSLCDSERCVWSESKEYQKIINVPFGVHFLCLGRRLVMLWRFHHLESMVIMFSHTDFLYLNMVLHHLFHVDKCFVMENV
jgi:hypothetical protein